MTKKVYIVDDDEAVRDSLSFLLHTHNYDVTIFTDGEAFLETNLDEAEGPILLDVRMPGRNGIEILAEALSRNSGLNVVMMSGHADVAMAVRALKNGALDFIEKPFQSVELLKVLERINAKLTSERANENEHNVLLGKLEKLTPREHEVMAHLVEGKPNKIVASDLGLSVRTVETHRAHLLSKLEVKSLSDLVRISMIAS